MVATKTEHLPVTKPIFIIGTGRCGSTAFHRPDCHLVHDHPRLRTMTSEMAVEEGLAPCRACEPETTLHLPG